MRDSSLLPAAVLAGALVLGCGDQPDVVAPATEFARVAAQSVSGHIERDFTEFGVPVEKYSFHAHYLGNGRVEGRFRVMDLFADGFKEVASGSVTCFAVEADGKTARIGGIVEATTRPENRGTDAVWTVVDNGEGANAPRDQATDLRFAQAPGTTAFHCDPGIPPEAFGTFGENVRANVQVRP
jgi:hypothetical protein